MIKTIIADDEDIIREGISNFIDWASLDLELVGQASNGKEAETLIQVAEPEIIITDVKMPRMSGIELLALAKEKQPDCIVIMISSYDQFEYAHQSLNLGAFAYLLKPIDTDKLIELLKEAVERLTRMSTEKKMLDTYKDVLEQAQTDILENKLKVLVLGGEVAEFNFGEMRYLRQFSYFTILTAHTTQPVFHEETFAEELEKKLDIWAAEQRDYLEIKRFQTQNWMTIFCILHKSGGEVLYRRLYSIYAQYYKKTALGISEALDLIKDLAGAYRQSLEAIEYRFFTSKPIVFYQDVKREVHTSFKNMPDWSVILRDCLNGGTEDNIKGFTDSLLAYIYDTKPSGVIIHTTVSAILLEIIKILREAGGKPEDLFLSVSDTITSILDEKNPTLMVQKLQQVIFSAVEYIARLELLRPNSVVFKARRYIEENYHNPNLRLDNVANYVYINPSYFSTIFSRELNISFGDYLTKVRMEKATQLLKTTHLKIYEIAEQVGYQNVSWFNVAFKKYIGKKPRDFRK